MSVKPYFWPKNTCNIKLDKREVLTELNKLEVPIKLDKLKVFTKLNKLEVPLFILKVF